jgi:hypothetical protein
MAPSAAALFVCQTCAAGYRQQATGYRLQAMQLYIQLYTPLAGELEGQEQV